jgi:hypothetical protein
MTSTDDLFQELLAQMCTMQTVQNSGSGKITYTASGPSGIVSLNPNYYTDLVITLVGGTSTDTNVFLQLKTEQSAQMPAKYLMNSSMSKIRIEGVQANQVSTDTTLTTGQSLYVYFIGYSNPTKPKIKY